MILKVSMAAIQAAEKLFLDVEDNCGKYERPREWVVSFAAFFTECGTWPSELVEFSQRVASARLHFIDFTAS